MDATSLDDHTIATVTGVSGTVGDQPNDGSEGHTLYI